MSKSTVIGQMLFLTHSPRSSRVIWIQQRANRAYGALGVLSVLETQCWDFYGLKNQRVALQYEEQNVLLR